MRQFSGCYPHKSELAAAPGVVTDLVKFVDYGVTLGTSAPPVAAVTAAINVALQWRAMRDSTETWDTYVRAEDAMAWQAAMTYLGDIKPLFLIAVSKNPSLVMTYPWLAQMFDAPKVSARQAKVTRKKNAKAAAASAAAAAKTTAEAASAAPVAAAAPTVLVNAQAGGSK